MRNPNIIFLDAGSVDLGDLDLRRLNACGSLTLYPNTSDAQMIPRLKSADIIVTNKCIVNEKILKQLPKLRLVCVAATGVNNIDLGTAKKRNVAVTNVAGYSTTTVAEHTLMMLLALSHRLMEHHSAACDGQWSRSPHFALLNHPFSDLYGKFLGIIGYGKIGKQVARLAKTFGMKILVARLPGRNYSRGDKRLPLSTVLKKADFVTLHCPLTRNTHHLIHRDNIRLMKPTASLINMARGPVVEESAVAEALKKKHLASYAADVLDREPPSKNHPFFSKNLRNKILITPHVAWASRESRQRLADEMAANIEAFKKGKKRNRIV